MQHITTSRWPAPKRPACTFGKVLAVGLFLWLSAEIKLQGQQPPPDPRPVGSHSSSSIKGTVRDSRGLPLVGVQVPLQAHNNDSLATQATHNNGLFTLTDLPAGTYQIRIVAAGRQPFVSGPLVVGAGTRHELPVVVMRMVTKTTT